jgi:hypothetical protein
LIALVRRSFRGEDPNGYPDPGSLFKYKPPSLLAQYKGLAIAFVIVLIATAVYFYKLPRTPVYFPPPTVEIYVEPIPKGP